MAERPLEAFKSGPGSIPDVIKITPEIEDLDPTKTDGRSLRILLNDFVDTLFARANGGLTRTITPNLPEGRVGGIKNGEPLEEGTPITDVVEKLVRAASVVAYAKPNAKLSYTPNRTLEIGEVVNLNFGLSFNQNDAGPLQGIQLFENGVQIGDTNPYLLEDYIASASADQFRAKAFYATGAVKNDSLGQPQTGGRILAGTVDSDMVLVRGYHKIWVGPVSAAPATGVEVRTLLSGVFTNSLTEGNKLTLNTGSTDIKFAILLPPGMILHTVIDADSANANLTAGYVLLTDNFTGQDAGGNPVPGCSLFMLSQSVPYSSNHRHIVTVI